ncbi:hypothetical protein [Streptomyces xanthochromogenes]|uniref:hypothetical protein n=1 Tax=Streptomyces xanthochromogenes TaxID=67384 RepID=UPI001E60DEA0|nr:hypothetical protein [Streptomyces xanthochromogenes]
MTTPSAPVAARDIPSDQRGNCAICSTLIQRYGAGGNPLCRSCLARVQGDAERKKPSA